MSQKQEEVRLSPCEREVWDKIRRKMAVEGKTGFNADDLHYWTLDDGTPLDKALYGSDKQKAGLFLEKAWMLGLSVKANRVLGRYNRYIWNYKVVEK